MSDAPIVLVSLDRPKLRAGYESDWQSAMALKAHIAQIREIAKANEIARAKRAVFYSYASIICLLIFLVLHAIM